MRNRFLWTIVLGLLVLGTYNAAAKDEQTSEKRIKELIQKLGAGNFQGREAAEKELVSLGAAALPELKKYKSSSDPELAERTSRIIDTILADPANVPESFFVFDEDPSVKNWQAKKAWEEWNTKMEAWKAGATVAVCTVPTNSNWFTLGSFVQSFIPRTKRINAVAIKLHYLRNRSGWLLLEICEDIDGKPKKYSMTRAWVHSPIHSGLIPSKWLTVFDIPDVEVLPNKKYWIRYIDEKEVTNHGVSSKDDGYPSGEYATIAEGDTPAGKIALNNDKDAAFEILSECGPIPVFRRATDTEVAELKRSGEFGTLKEKIRTVPEGKLCEFAVKQYVLEKYGAPEIIDLFEKAAAGGDVRAVMWKARILFGGRCSTTPQPEQGKKMAEEVFEDVRKLAEAGDCEAQFLMGAAYDDGLAVKTDCKKAFEWYDKAASNGHIVAINNLGLCYARGYGTEADIDKARQLFTQAEALESKAGNRNNYQYRDSGRNDAKRLKFLRETPAVRALGMTREKGIAFLMKQGLVTNADKSRKVEIGHYRNILFETDGVLIKIDLKNDCIMNVEGFRGGRRMFNQFNKEIEVGSFNGKIPFNLTWADNMDKLKNVLGEDDDSGDVPDDNAYGRAYRIGNLTFSTMFDSKNRFAIWRVYERWAVKNKDETGP